MSIPRAFLLLLAIFASAVPAGAASLSMESLNSRQFYTDLPGVKPPEVAEDEKRIFCEQTVVEAEGHPTFRPRYRTINNCRRGNGPVFQSPRSPVSIERQLRGLNY